MKVKRIEEMRSHIPNLLTMIRVALVPIFIRFLFFCDCPNAYCKAFFVFVVAALTDYVDGFLARKWQVISDFGKLMDPLADKLLVLSAILGLSILKPFKLHIAIFILILARELIISILREIYNKRGIVVAADNLGKLKTVMQMGGIIVALFLMAFMEIVHPYWVLGIRIWFWLVLVITLMSGINYLKVFFKKE